MSKRNIAIVIVISILVFAIGGIIFMNQSSEQNGLIFTIFMPELQKASDDFYSEYLSTNPTVANYSGEVISLKKSVKGYYIIFGIQPYIGPHYPVGYDEVEYFVDNIGTITLLNYLHKKNYRFPPRLGVSIKKSIPIS
jgi:hypothetical protein